MRIRSIKPAYWSDHDLQTALTAAEREFYVGLWMQADDAGWLSWDVHRIGAELYPFRTVKARESFIGATAAKLAALNGDAPHLVIFKHCGHAVVPKMPLHQHQSGKPVYTVHAAHQRCPAEPREEPRETAEARHGKGSNGEVSKGKVVREEIGSKEPIDERSASAARAYAVLNSDASESMKQAARDQLSMLGLS